MGIAENIKNMRKKKKLTQEDISKRSGISQSAISRIEKGANSPSVETLQMIADALGCSLLELSDEKESIGNKLSDFDKQFIEACKELTDAQKQRVMDFISGMVDK